MIQVTALIDFAGSSINREDLGIVRKGSVVAVSENDAQYLERDGLVERVEAEAATDAGERTGASDNGSNTATSEPITTPPSTANTNTE